MPVSFLDPRRQQGFYSGLGLVTVLLALAVMLIGSSQCQAAGEPAEEFLKRLRAAKYFDTAIAYLNRIDQYPGVDPKLKNAIRLEKAQTFIEAAVASRNPGKRDDFFRLAEQELSEFLKQESHPRTSEAQLQLGRLQMVRAAQLMTGQPDDAKREAARQSYIAAAKTFDQIKAGLKSKLEEMQGAKIDPKKDPEAAALRNQYRGEYLQAISSAGESRYFAAKTYNVPAKDGKPLLETALTTFTDLSKKYDGYVQGAIAMLYRGQVQEELGMSKEALDSYLRMLEQPDADQLRDAKFQATSGLIRLSMAEPKPKFQTAIDRGQPLIDNVRPNERALPSVQRLRIELAKAYLAKSKAEGEAKPAEMKRAEVSGRQLLIQASKLPGDEAETASRLLANMGIELGTTTELPAGEDPDSLEDALSTARDLLTTVDGLAQSLAVLEKQPDASAEVAKQKAEIQQQLEETRAIALQVLRRGLSMVTIDSDIELVNQTRQFLAYLLYQQKQYREAAVVGTFLSRNAPASEVGLRGGLLALNSLQLLLVEDADNAQMISHLEALGSYLTETWPDNPEASAARGVMIKLALRNDRWAEARATIEKMPKGDERAYFHRLMGQLLWNESVQARQNGDDQRADQALAEAKADLQTGLDGIPKLVDPEGMRTALILAKVHLKQGDAESAAKVLSHETYGPVPLVEQQGAPDKTFASDLYSTELQVVVQQMSADQGNSQELLKRAIDVMEKLRESVEGPDSQKTLTGIYIRMARDIRDQLDRADPAKKARLIAAFRVFLDRIASTTNDLATLQWVGQTLIDLGEASMRPNEIKATGQAAELLTTAVATFTRIKEVAENPPLTVDYLLGKAYRLLGQYKDAVDTFKGLLSQKPMMLDAQMEAARAYEQWAAVVPPKFAGKWYEFALNGAKPGPDKKNIIWGWGKVSQMTSRDPKYREMFFDARYHVALCRFLWGKAIKSQKVVEKAASDITTVNALYPEMGGKDQRAKFDRLLKLIQTELKQKPDGLPPLPAPKV